MIENYPLFRDYLLAELDAIVPRDDMTPRQRLLIRAALAVVLLAVISHTRADPDLWGHVLFGQDIVSTASIPATDSYSFTSDRSGSITNGWLNARCTSHSRSVVVLGSSSSRCWSSLAMLALVWSALRRQQVDAAHARPVDRARRRRHVSAGEPCAAADLFGRRVRAPDLDSRRQWTGSTPAADSAALRRVGQLSWRLDRRRRCAGDVGVCW